LSGLGAKEEGRILLYDPQTGKMVKELEKSGGYVFHLQFLKDGKRLLAANGGAGCAIWNIETEEMEEIFRTANDTRWVELEREENRIIATARVGEVFLYHRSGVVANASVKASEKFIHCATFSPDGQHIAVADEAGELTIWEMTSPKQSPVAKSNEPGNE
jgi:tricorn protease-like protein